MRLIQLAMAGLVFCAGPLPAQVTRTDSAAVLLHTARDLEASGRRELALELYRLIRSRYAGTAAARHADSALADLRGRATGQTELMVWMTLNGAFLGFAIPTALDAQEPEPYGAGLLLATPAALMGARAYANATAVTTGRARAIIFGSQWGIWQGVALREVFDIGDRSETFCFPSGGQEPDVCYTDRIEPSTAPWAAAVIGNLAGITAGAVLGTLWDPSAGDATLVNHAAYWGTWYGLAGWVLLTGESDPSDDRDDEDDVLTFLLAGGNAAALGAALATAKSDWSAARVRLVSVGGVAGLLVGAGLDLLFDVQDSDTAILIPTVTGTLGMVVSARATRNAAPDAPSRAGAGPGLALINLDHGVRVGLPIPQPDALLTRLARGRSDGNLAVRLPLLHARF